ncbi:semaphorin-4B-like [Cottoperca gobio]|uniref:Semaphorin-4B-like n=1 Tax=Cottoperca gobio TaxID=56716 RepID=A0A6J2PEF6_COTGO|nr:semaphorin-4B-like [Cottoperca gobio]
MVQQDPAKDKLRCPFSPLQKNSAITVDDELFTATTTDFRGEKPQISRHFSKDGRQDVSQDSSFSLLEEPAFVGSSSDPTDGKLYFFFSEVGKEFIFVDELRIARVAQVCKDDVGGQRTLQNKWTSFAKASLLCQLPKQLPFNVLQDVFTLPPPEGGLASDTLFYGVFTSQWSVGPESAVCVFKLQDVRTVFAGSYRTFDMQTHQWSSIQGKHSYLGQCGLNNATDSELAQVKKSFLTGGSVKPMEGGQIVVSSEQRYSHVAAMRTLAANGKQYTVLFLLTESGFLHKVVLLGRGAQVIEEIQVFTQPQLVKSIVLSSKGVLYVGTSEGVTAVPVSRCSIYRTCGQCVLARDPLCGWSRTGSVCTAVNGSHENMTQDLEDDNVEEKCRGEGGAGRLTVIAHLNEAVRLQCLTPSSLASLTWTSPRFRNLPEKLFIRSADGSLSFFATADTFGTYSCEAQEGGYREVIASHEVRRAATPRSISPFPKADESHMTNEGESDEDILTEAPFTSTPRPSGDSETFTTEPIEGFNPTPGRDGRPWKEPLDGPRLQQQSYYNALVVVSILLAACVCLLMLGGLHVWRRRDAGLKTSPLVSPEDGSRINRAMERVPSLSSPEEAGPELKVE